MDNVKKEKSGIGKFVISFLLAFIIFIVLLIIQSNVLNKTTTEKVLIAKDTIEQRTDITASNYKNYFEIVDRTKSQLPENAILAKDVKKAIDNKTIIQKMSKGTILTKDATINTKETIDYIGKDELQVGINVSEVSKAICGTLRRGDIVNITLISASNAEGEENKVETLKNIMIENAYDSSGVEVTDAKAKSSSSNSDSTASVATMFKCILKSDDYDKYVRAVASNQFIIISKASDVLTDSDINTMINSDQTTTNDTTNTDDVQSEN